MDYRQWKVQFEHSKDVGKFFASDRKSAKRFFPVYVRDWLDLSGRDGLDSLLHKVFTISTPDYKFIFDNICDEHPVELSIHSRTRHIIPEMYEGEAMELAEYAAKRIGRTGVSRLLLNVAPDVLVSAMTKADDFFNNLFYPVTSKVSNFLDEAFD